MDLFLLTLLVKMAAAAAIVVLASMTTERVGPFLGSMVATLPISAGPIYVILSLDHDARFISDAALVSLASNPTTAIITLVYAAAAQRLTMAPSLAAAVLVWAILGSVVVHMSWTLPAVLLLNAAVYATAIIVSSRYTRAAMTRRPISRWYDIPLRALGVASLAGSVTVLSATAGPAYTGLFSAFPVVFVSLIAILHPRIGGPATAAVLCNGLKGLVGFGGAIMTLHLLAPAHGSAVALSAALAVSVTWNVTLVLLSGALGKAKPKTT